MKKKSLRKETPVWVTALLCLTFAALGIAQYANVSSKIVGLIAGAGIIVLLLEGDLKRLWNWPSVLLIGYVAFSMFTALWAISGKFFLREYTKVFISAFFFLLVALRSRCDRDFVRRTMAIITGVSTIYAYLSVEAASVGVVKSLLQSTQAFEKTAMQFGDRLWGIFGNPNIEASFYAIGIIFSVALICGADRRWKRFLWIAVLSINAYAFLLAISLGAMACFAVAVIAYLIFAGKGRIAALLRMLEVAVPAVVCAILAYRYFNVDGKEFLPLLLLFSNAVIAILLEATIANRAAAALEAHQKPVFGTVIGVALLVACYLAVGLQLTGAYTFGNPLSRRANLKAGEHTLYVETDGEVNVRIYSLNRAQVLYRGNKTLYDDVVAGTVYFEVPEDTAICSFYFTAPSGTVLRSAVLDGRTKIALDYRLLPDFVASRLQNLGANSSQMQRETYVRDALRLFRRRPIAGYGVGAFETAITSVQEFPYQTKYVHNHYVQILLEDGMIGFALFAGSLVAMGAVLWKKRKGMLEGEFCWVYPALCAEFVMNGLQMLWDLSMSTTAFLCQTYATYGLIVALCAEPIGQKATQAEAGTPRKKKKQKRQQPDPLLIRITCVTLPALYMLTVCLNLYANRLTHKEPHIFSDFEEAIKIDLYEYNDWKLSYVFGAQSEGTGEHIAQADVYAEQLSKVQSNMIPRYLTTYYLNTQQYEKAIDAAMLGATYSASDSDVWNGTITSLKLMLVDIGPASPLLSQGNVLLPKLLEYYAMLEHYNETALVPISLTENSQIFFDKVLALNECTGDADAMLAILLEVPAE